MTYAVIDVGGNQLLIEPGKFYDVNYIYANPGDLVNFKRVLMISNANNYTVGRPCLDNVLVKATVLKHLQGKKIKVFKVKPKKNNRVTKGYRQKSTRIFIESIVM
uniref:Large ribosomal subunit protein bL21c n=1 Tax=Polysiphonia scopulorum TaxID=257860 RepID=A0A1Z1MIE0_9FLOR|nr:ribosomal protein L21 [Polysiphonia scopulorum]ARW65511.1 ribosomal protein L21 [Polysiphonia scopulorum]